MVNWPGGHQQSLTAATSRWSPALEPLKGVGASVVVSAVGDPIDPARWQPIIAAASRRSEQGVRAKAMTLVGNVFVPCGSKSCSQIYNSRERCTTPLPRRKWISSLPIIRQPLADLADRCGRQVRQQLRQISLRIDGVSPAGASQAGKDRRSLATSLVANKKTVFTIQTDSLHFPFTDVVIYRYGAVGCEDAQFIPLVKRVIDRLGHRMLGQQLILPRPQPFAQTEQNRL